MKHLLTVFLFAFAILLCTQSYAQSAKVKTKGNKTKVKGAETNTGATGTMSTAVAAPSATGLTNTSWKAYIGDPLNDTLTLKYAVDSSFALSRTGDAVVISLYTAIGDTLSISDVGGMYQCPNQTGKYRFLISGDTMTLTLIEDACDGRAAALNNTKWQRAAGKGY